MEEEKREADQEIDNEDWNPYRDDQRLGRRMRVMRLRYMLSCGDALQEDPAPLRTELVGLMKEFEMGPYYADACKDAGIPVDAAVAASLAEANAKEEAALDARRKDAEEQYGDTEVQDAVIAKADFFARIGDQARALATLDEVTTFKISANTSIDVALTKLRVALFHRDTRLARECVDKAEQLIDEKGDWDRRNRFKVYKGLFSLLTRDFKTASALFLESLATFTAYEVVAYNDFVLYAVLTSLLHLPRSELRPKVVESPDVVSVVDQIPHLTMLSLSFYQCEYRSLFESFVAMYPSLAVDPFMGTHAAFYARELRVSSYAQFLDAYRSVTLDNTAKTFGVTVEFADAELSRFISAGRLHAKIDKVGGVLETNRSDAKTAQYEAVLTQGDALLNRVQKLTRVINA